jgi:simple sugar transport system permease protein/ribose transport system permease protein
MSAQQREEVVMDPEPDLDTQSAQGLAATRPQRIPGAVALVQGVVVVGLVVFALTTDRFFTVDNARAILASAAFVGITAIGASIVMIGGSTVSLATAQTATVAGMVFLSMQDRGLLVAMVVAAVISIVLTGLQGGAIGYWDSNPIVLTIAAGFAIGGGLLWLSGGTPVYASAGHYDVLNSTPLGLPLSVYVLLAVAVVAEWILRRTTVGRHLYLVGAHRAAARAAGLPVGRVTVLAWAFFGLCIAVTGMFLAAFNTSANASLAGNLTLDSIAAVLVGGTAIAGGSGSAVRTLGGTLLISVIADVLLIRGASTGLQTLAQGVLVMVVVVTMHLRGSRGRGATR